MNAIRPTARFHPGPLRAVGFAAALSILVMAPAASAQVAAGWTQFQGGPEHPGVAAGGAAPPYATEWTASVPLGGPGNHYGLSAPVLVGDQAVVVAPEQVMGFDVATGASTFSVDRDFGPAVPAAVAQVGGRQVVVFTEGFAGSGPGATPSATAATPSPSVSGSSPAPASAVDSHLAAFDLRTHEPLWDPLALDDVSKSGVTVVGTTAFVGTDAGTVYAVDLSKGTAIWSSDVGDELLSPLAATEDVVITGVAGDARTQPAVVALNAPDGTQVWKFEPPSAGLASGVAIGDDRVFVGFTDTTVHALDLRTGTDVWSSRLNALMYPQSGPAVADGAVYALDVNGQLYRFDTSDGSRVWDFALNALTSRGWPVVSGDHVLLATDDGRLAAIAVADGHLVWDSGPGSGPLRWLVPTADRILGVRGGTDPGLESFANDPSGSLVDEVSPTEPDPVVIARNFAVATLPILVLLIFLGRWLGPRMGPAFILVDEDGAPSTEADEDEPKDER